MHPFHDLADQVRDSPKAIGSVSGRHCQTVLVAFSHGCNCHGRTDPARLRAAAHHACTPEIAIINVFPSLKRGDFRPLEAAVPARDEDIDSGVDVPVMPSTTAATDPVPHYEALSTLWAAACSARGTDLRGQATSSLLGLPAIVPDPAHRPSLLLQMPSGARILDPVSVGQHPVNRVVERWRENKTDAKHPVGTFTLELPSEMPEVSNVYGATRLGSGLKDLSCPRSQIPNSLPLTGTARAGCRAPPPRPERRGFRRGELR